MSAPELKEPRVPMNRRTLGGGPKWAWIFQRISGVILIALIFTHLFVNLLTGDGINQIDFAFVAGKWASPLWKWWDFTMLVLAMIHGTNGMRLLVEDYARKVFVRYMLLWALNIAMVVTIVLGTLMIFTFDPCPVDAAGALLPEVPAFCEDVR